VNDKLDIGAEVPRCRGAEVPGVGVLCQHF
jgi:hypothetical protein